jgi:hypothetical protein
VIDCILISTINSATQANTHNHVFLKLGTELPRQIHRRLLQTVDTRIISTKKLIACSLEHEFELQRPSSTPHWQVVESCPTPKQHHLGSTMSDENRTCRCSTRQEHLKQFTKHSSASDARPWFSEPQPS